MQPPPPVITIDLFGEERGALLTALESLTATEWDAPTACPGWSVKDIAVHIIADDLGTVARERDRHFYAPFRDAEPSWQELLAFINRQNEEWVVAMRRLSPRQVCDLLSVSGPHASDVWRARDPMALGGAVSWAGPQPAPNWLDIAREYTERWLHQAQIREAAGQPLLLEPRAFAPVLATFVRALPHTYRDTAAPEGTHVRFVIAGEAGGGWSLVRERDAWALYDFSETLASAVVSIDEDTAWRMFTKGLPFDNVRSRARISGDPALGEVALRSVAIIA